MTLSHQRMIELLAPYTTDDPLTECVNHKSVSLQDQLPPEVVEHLSTFLDLLVRWNTRTNLTAVRSPEQIVTRHFGESLFLARKLCPLLSYGDQVLDFGSGAGFPGIPLQLLCPEQNVLLTESQGKKASFLREAVRTLGLRSEVWSGRVENLPRTRTFGAVCLRAVDNFPAAFDEASTRIAPCGHLALLVGADPPPLQTGFELVGDWILPQSSRRSLVIARSISFPKVD